VLHNAIMAGVKSTEYFALASGFDGTRYIELKFNRSIETVERSGCLVKVGVAQKQLAEEAAAKQKSAAASQGSGGTVVGVVNVENAEDAPSTPGGGSGSPAGKDDPAPALPKDTRFYMSAQLDTTRIGRDVQKLVEEVVSHLTSANGAQVEVSLEVNAKSPDGLPPQIVRTILENCQTLKVKDFGFEE
jgi:hypothetical protein